MNILDWIIIIPVAAGFVFGLFKGLVRELFSLAAIVLGFLGARFFEPKMSALLLSAFDIQVSTARPLSYLILFLAIAVLMLLVARLIDKLFSAIALGGVNKLLGGVFGAVKFALIVSVLLNVFSVFDSRFSIVKEETKKQSFAYKSALALAPVVWKETQELIFTDEDKTNDDENEN